MLKGAGFTRIRAGQGKAKRTPNSNKAHTQGLYMTEKKKKSIMTIFCFPKCP
jgi:hypothetical protein